MRGRATAAGLVTLALIGSLPACCSQEERGSTVKSPSPTTPPAPKPAAPVEHSMKGWELYSWQADGAWRFAILVGTNRDKSPDEIRAAGVSLDQLESKLAALPRGEDVCISKGGVGAAPADPALVAPPDDARARINAVAEKGGLQLSG